GRKKKRYIRFAEASAFSQPYSRRAKSRTTSCECRSSKRKKPSKGRLDGGRRRIASSWLANSNESRTGRAISLRASSARSSQATTLQTPLQTRWLSSLTHARVTPAPPNENVVRAKSLGAPRVRRD